MKMKVKGNIEKTHENKMKDEDERKMYERMNEAHTWNSKKIKYIWGLEN